MKKAENLIKSACALTVLILTLFYLFALTPGFAQPYIDFGTFALIFLFAVIISVANLILGLDRFKLPVRIIIHYLALLCAFTAVFVMAGKLTDGGVGTVFSAVIIFTFLYAVIAPIAYFALKAIRAADRQMDKKLAEKQAKKPEKKKAEYKSLYK